MKSNGKKLLPALLTVLLVAVMVGLSEILNEKEIIFPEITALAVGTLVAPSISWKTSRVRMVILIAICSVAGLVLSVYVPFSLIVKVILGYSFCNVVYIYSGTSFAPLISATILPVLMGTESIIYPISSVIFTLLIIAFEGLLFIVRCKEKEVYVKVNKPVARTYIDVIKRIILVSIVSFIAIEFFDKFVIAPPLMVAFTEFSNIESKARKKPLHIVITVTACAGFGAFARIIICEYLGLTLMFAAVVAVIMMIILMKFIKMYIPPAGALTILPMLISSDKLYIYPVEIFAGISIFVVAALVLFKEKTKL